MKGFSFAAVLACVISLVGVSTAVAQGVATASAAVDKPVTLTGCVVKGESGGYLLTGVANTTPGSTVATPPAGTLTAVTRASHVLYWLDDDDEVKGHTGRRVEISGEIEAEIEKGEIELERMDNGMIKLQAKYDGKTVTALLASVPAAVGTAGAAGDKEVEVDYIVRRVDVKSVRMIADNCR